MTQLTHDDASVILQFGTSRFLQAHVDYFIGQSIANGRSNSKVLVVQTSTSKAGKQRVQAMNHLSAYPVKIQGVMNGEVIDREEQIFSIVAGLQADEDWDEIEAVFCSRVSFVVSNTADQGYALFSEDSLSDRPPRSYPAKLLSLLFARFKENARPVTLLPCELIADNGEVLKKIVTKLARDWQLSDEFICWLQEQCIWANSLVDRIVSQSIEPLGAIAEPYALWAIENQPGLTLPCTHEDIRIVKQLSSLEWLKLGVLNLSHTYLVDLWLQQSNPEPETVLQIMLAEGFRYELEQLWAEEIIPILLAMSLGEDVKAYVESVRERFLNPFLHHQLKDIAQNHQAKVERRVLPIYQQVEYLKLDLPTPRLKACLKRHGLLP